MGLAGFDRLITFRADARGERLVWADEMGLIKIDLGC